MASQVSLDNYSEEVSANGGPVSPVGPPRPNPATKTEFETSNAGQQDSDEDSTGGDPIQPVGPPNPVPPEGEE